MFVFSYLMEKLYLKHFPSERVAVIGCAVGVLESRRRRKANKHVLHYDSESIVF